MKKILWVSDNPTLYTGFGRVGKEILTQLHKTGDYEIICLGWYYDGHPYDTQKIPFEIYQPGTTEFGQDVLGKIIESRHPDIMISLGDIWMVYWIANLPERQNTKWIGYFPIDGEPLPASWTPIIKAMDAPVCYSRYAQRVITEAVPDIKTYLIYHGVDTEVFKPLLDKQLLKKREGIGNRFVVGCVARNQSRKQIPILIKAFAQFSANKDDVFLYLHMAPRDAGWNIPELLERYKLQYKSYVSGVTPIEGFSDEKLNQIYNYFDVFALPSIGEGFGLPILEAMACGVPVVVTNYSAPVELVEGRGELIKVKELLTIGIHNIDQAIADVDDLADKLELLYSNPSLREKYGQKGREFALTMTWDTLIPQWKQLIDNVVSD